MRIIVNADDLGSSPRINAAIFALMEAGRVRSASLLVNGRSFDIAAVRSRDFPHCSFGVHLNVATGTPVGDTRAIAPILAPDGTFQPKTFRSLFVPAAVRNAVLCEWRSQLAKALAALGQISHIDSHHHDHTVPALFGILKQLQREFGIRRVRPAHAAVARGFRSFPVFLARAMWNRALRKDGTRTPDAFLSLAEFEAISSARRRRFETVEIMVHPGSKARLAETLLLESDWWEQEMRGRELISYSEL